MTLDFWCRCWYYYHMAWRKEDEDFLVKNYGKLKKLEIAKILGKTEGSIRNKASRLGLKSNLPRVSRLNQGRESYLKWLKTSEYILLEDYTKSSDKLLHQHKTCGRFSRFSPNNARKMVSCKHCYKRAYSKLAIEWLNTFNNPRILHAENGGEQVVAGYKVDGYDPSTKTVYEFHGDAWHGNPDIYEPHEKCHPYKNLTAEELFLATVRKSQKLSIVATVIEIWEADYRNGRS